MAAEDSKAHLYKGSCHCGFFTYQAEIDFQSPKPMFGGKQLSKCNCSICHKTGAPLIFPVEGSFKIITPEGGRGELTTYKFKPTSGICHLLCPKCGIKCLVEGEIAMNGKTVKFQRINVKTVDGRADGSPMDDLRNLTIGYIAGAGDQWAKGIADKPYEGGIW